MAEFRLKAKDTKSLIEVLECGLRNNNKPSAAVVRRILILLSRIEKRQGDQEVFLELPDVDQL